MDNFDDDGKFALRSAFMERRRRGKVFDSAQLQLLILHLIDAEPRHGYEIIREIETRTGGVYAPSPGMVYPNLTLLVEMGHAEETAAPGAKKVFTTTAEGKAALAEGTDTVKALLARLDAIADRSAHMRTGPVHRAMQNLRMALRDRLGRAEGDEDTAFAIAQILDEAAGRIERLK